MHKDQEKRIETLHTQDKARERVAKKAREEVVKKVSACREKASERNQHSL